MPTQGTARRQPFEPARSESSATMAGRSFDLNERCRKVIARLEDLAVCNGDRLQRGREAQAKVAAAIERLEQFQNDHRS